MRGNCVVSDMWRIKVKMLDRWMTSGIVIALLAMRTVHAEIPPPVPPLSPDDGDTFNVYVNDQETYDSNLYRLPAGYDIATIAASATKADTINTASLGGEGQLLLGRQVFDVHVRADDNRFAHNGFLNNTSTSEKLLWNWIVGSQFSGDAGVLYDRMLANFAETLYLGKDSVDTTQYYGTGRYQFGPHWALFGEIHDSDSVHSAKAAAYNDFRAKSGAAGIEYAANAENSIQAEYRYTDGYYAQDYLFADIPLDRNYHEDITRVLGRYTLTDKTQITAYGGYLKRQYQAAGIGEYHGDIWRVTADWRPTDKTELVGAVWRELHAYLVDASDFFVSQGGSIAPAWSPTEKIKLSVVLSYEDQNYIESSTSQLIVGPRHDKIYSEQANILYTARDSLFFNFFIRAEKRNSNQLELAYSDQLANLSVTFKFW